MTVIATCAFAGSYDVEANLVSHHATIDEAADRGASLLVFPECSLHGYPDWERRHGTAGLLETWERAEAVPGGASVRRIAEHAQDLFEGFTKKYGVKMLVYYEMFATMPEAIAREKQLKAGTGLGKSGLSSR